MDIVGGSIMYTIKKHNAEISVEEYLENYVDVEKFISFCKECPNYGNNPACPPFNFDPMDYWRGFRTLKLKAVEILFDEHCRGRSFEKEELHEIISSSLKKEKRKLLAEGYDEEGRTPGSVSLFAGSCELCRDGCTLSCRFPDKMRHSVESLGGDVGKTARELMGIDIQWIKNDILPEKLVLVCGLLCP